MKRFMILLATTFVLTLGVVGSNWALNTTSVHALCASGFLKTGVYKNITNQSNITEVHVRFVCNDTGRASAQTGYWLQYYYKCQLGVCKSSPYQMTNGGPDFREWEKAVTNSTNAKHHIWLKNVTDNRMRVWTYIDYKSQYREDYGVNDNFIKVSDSASFRLPPPPPSFSDSEFEFYEDNRGNKLECLIRGSQVGSRGTFYFKNHRYCDNDDARSLRLDNVPAGTVIRVYDDPQCRSYKDDWTEILVKKYVDYYHIATFERSFENLSVRVRYKTSGNLDGKVSCVKITAPN